MPRSVRIGSLREKVDVLEEPLAGWPGRIGRIKHRNGENVEIDFETLQALMRRAEDDRQTILFA